MTEPMAKVGPTAPCVRPWGWPCRGAWGMPVPAPWVAPCSPIAMPRRSAAPSHPRGSGKFANALSLTVPPTPEDGKWLDDAAQGFYKVFRDKAAASRGMTVEAMQV